MKWLEISVYTTDDGLDYVCAALDGAGITGQSIEESRTAAAAFLRESVLYWDFADMDKIGTDRPCVKGYVADCPENYEKVEAAKEAVARLNTLDLGVDLGSLAVTVRTVDEEDWANNWKQYYKPLLIGKRLLVLPCWEQQPETDRVVLKLDPGMAFGMFPGNSLFHQIVRAPVQSKKKNGPDPGVAQIPFSTVDQLLVLKGLLAVEGVLLGIFVGGEESVVHLPAPARAGFSVLVCSLIRGSLFRALPLGPLGGVRGLCGLPLRIKAGRQRAARQKGRQAEPGGDLLNFVHLSVCLPVYFFQSLRGVQSIFRISPKRPSISSHCSSVTGSGFMSPP